MSAHAATILRELSERGVEIKVVDGEVRFRPQSAVPEELRARIRNHKAELIAEISSRAPTEVTSKTPKTPLPEVLEVPPERARKKRAAAPAPNAYLDIVESWAPAPTAEAPTMDAFGISKVVVIPPVDPEKEPNVFAHVVIVLGGAVLVRGIVAHRTIAGHLSIKYPQVPGPNGKKIDVIRPVSPGAARALDQRILAELHGKGFLLAQLEPAPEADGEVES